jgi:ABC-type branched-subunit amino acid transport system ATPase component
LLKAMSGFSYTEEGVSRTARSASATRKFKASRPDELVRRGIVQVPEGRRVFPALTIDENLQMGGYTKTAPKRATARKVFALFPRLFERRDQIAGYMSGGEQQMLAIGRALMTDPVLLALDEPSLGLAPLIIDRIYEVIAKLRDEMKMTVLLVEQNAQRALDIADYGLHPGNRARRARRHGAEAGVERGRAGILSRRLQIPSARACATSSITSGANGGCRDPRSLRSENLSKRFGGLQAVADVSLAVTAGARSAA